MGQVSTTSDSDMSHTPAPVALPLVRAGRLWWWGPLRGVDIVGWGQHWWHPVLIPHVGRRTLIPRQRRVVGVQVGRRSWRSPIAGPDLGAHGYDRYRDPVSVVVVADIAAVVVEAAAVVVAVGEIVEVG